MLGDADCFSNAELQKSSRPGIYSFNFNMIPGSFRWLCYNEFPVSSSRAPYLDKDISLAPVDLSTQNYLLLWHSIYYWSVWHLDMLEKKKTIKRKNRETSGSADFVPVGSLILS